MWETVEATGDDDAWLAPLSEEDLVDRMDHDKNEDALPVGTDDKSEEIYQKIEDIFKLARKGQDAFFRDCPKAVADANEVVDYEG